MAAGDWCGCAGAPEPCTRCAWRGGSSDQPARGERMAEPMRLPAASACPPAKPHACAWSRRREETHCRFCSERLPDWRQSLTPHAAAEVRRCGLAPPATMTVAFLGQVGMAVGDNADHLQSSNIVCPQSAPE